MYSRRKQCAVDVDLRCLGLLDRERPAYLSSIDEVVIEVPRKEREINTVCLERGLLLF